MDQNMLGRWQVDHTLTENLDAFCTAMNFPADIKEKLGGSIEIYAELKQDGDTYTATTCYGGDVETLTFKIGEKFTSKGMGLEAENVFVIEGDVMVGTHTVLGQTTTSRRYMKDGKLVIESTGNGVTTVSYCVKC